MTPEEKAVIDAALIFRMDSVDPRWIDEGSLRDLVIAIDALERARENGRAADLIPHPFQPHHLDGSGIDPYTDYCIEALPGTNPAPGVHWWRACGRPRVEHAR